MDSSLVNPGNGSGKPLTLVVLISGNGSNLQAIIDAIGNGKLKAVIAVVISNRENAYGLMRARKANIPTRVAPDCDHPERIQYDRNLARLIDSFQPDFIVLAGFMRILSAGLVAKYRSKILNIHPSLLPKFKGTNTHQRALDAGEKEHGATVHLVTEVLDDGPQILQCRVTIEPDDDAETLRVRVLEQEHVIYPRVIQWFAEGRVRVENGSVIFNLEEEQHD